MRVTDNMRLYYANRENARIGERLANASRVAATGQRVTKPSDDPVAYAANIRRTADAARLSTHSKTAQSVADDLSVAERALDSAGELITSARSLALQGATESLDASDRLLLSKQVIALREQLLGVANSRGALGFLFGGTKTSTPPFDANGVFVGNDSVIRAPVTDSVDPPANASGAKAFTVAGGRDVFADLSQLSTALANNDVPAIQSMLDKLETGRQQITNVQVDTGLGIERLRSVADVLDQSVVAINSAGARDVGADDPASLYMELQNTQAAYQRSLSVTQRLLSLTTVSQ
mgnify:CR=1 FL=1